MEKKLEKLIKISVFIEFYYENIYLIVTHLKDKSKYNLNDYNSGKYNEVEGNIDSDWKDPRIDVEPIKIN